MKEQIEKTVEILRKGGVILYPTDTVWGIGCDATNPEAVNKLYTIKKRESGRGMIILVGSIDDVGRYVSKVPPVAWDLLEMATKPLTLILPRGANVASNLVGTDGSLGIRVPHSQFCKELLKRFGRPIVSTSANLAGKPAPITIDEISKEIVSKVDFVVSPHCDKGATHHASSIISIGVGGQVVVIRE